MTFRGPALQHSIRKGTIKQTENNTGDTFVVTIPKIIAEQFQNCFLRIYTSGNTIIMESGCKISIEDINIQEQNTYYGVRGITYSATGKRIYIK